MISAIQSFLPSIFMLGAVFAVAVLATNARSMISDSDLPGVNKLVLAACGIHVVHFTEEVVYDLHILLPRLFGLPPIPLWLFAGFNIAWILIWLAGSQFRSHRSFVIITFWFLALASALNGIMHPILAVVAGGYFPGLVTSPLSGLIGIILTRRLFLSSENNDGISAAV